MDMLNANFTRKEVAERNKELAIKKSLERKAKDRAWFNILRNSKKLSATELAVYREACEDYAAQLKAFHNGKIVKGKGKNQTVTVVPHPAEPSFNAIYKKYAKAAGLYKKTA
jgi:hypothetical protein